MPIRPPRIPKPEKFYSEPNETAFRKEVEATFRQLVTLTVGDDLGASYYTKAEVDALFGALTAADIGAGTFPGLGYIFPGAVDVSGFLTGLAGVVSGGDITALSGVVQAKGLALSIRAVSANTVVVDGDYTILVDASGGAVNVTADHTIRTGMLLNIKKEDATGNAVNIIGTVDGSSSVSLTTPKEVLTVQAYSTEWKEL